MPEMSTQNPPEVALVQEVRQEVPVPTAPIVETPSSTVPDEKIVLGMSGDEVPIEHPSEEPMFPQHVPTRPNNPGNARFAGMNQGFVGGTMGVMSVPSDGMLNPRFRR